MAVIDDAVQTVLDGGRLDRQAALALYQELPTHELGLLADSVRIKKHPDRIVSYIIDRNVNYTNICVAKCNFCAFYRDVGSGDGFVLGFEEIFEKILACASGAQSKSEVFGTGEDEFVPWTVGAIL